MIIGLIVALGATSVFERAESFIFKNFNANKVSQLKGMSALIDPKSHAQLNQNSINSHLFKQLFSAFQTNTEQTDSTDLFSVNIAKDSGKLTYGVSLLRTPENSLFIASDLFQVLILSTKGSLELVQIDLPGQSLVGHLSSIALTNGAKPQLKVNGQTILTILDKEKLTANYKDINLNRLSSQAYTATINLPSPIEVSFRAVAKNALIHPPGSPFFAPGELKRSLSTHLTANEQSYLTVEKDKSKSPRFLFAPLRIKNNTLAALVMYVPSETYRNISKGLFQSVLIIFSLMSVSILIAAMFLSRKITGPLEQLNQAIARLIRNDFNFKLSPKGFGSFKFLAEQFNQMLAHIQKSRGEMIQLNKSYHRFVPHGLLKQLGVASVEEISLGDCCEREMTVLFCDIRGFTSLSESMTPQANFNFINRYLSQIAPVINKRGGIIDKYMGDGIMALFPNSADDATMAAIEMLAALEKYNEKLRQKKLPIVEVGMGIHSGSMMLGTVGTSQRMDATVVSDTVNAAARVEALTKSFATKILITEETKRLLTDLTQYRLRYIAACRIRGKSKPVTLYEVFNNDSISLQEEKAANQPAMIRAWKTYREGDSARAVALYRRQIEKSPNDKSLFALIERCQSGRL